jgi:hypothetical protein
MNDSGFLIYDSPAGETTSFVAGNAIVQAPAYIPEIKGDEDIKALLRFSSVLPQGSPIIAPANRWTQLISNPLLGPKAPLGGLTPIDKFLPQHPIYFYDPPELFRYTFGEELVRYALKGEGIKEFNSHLKKNEMDEAIEMVPPFFRPFVQRQMTSILSKLNITNEDSRKSPPHVEKAWLEDQIDEAYVPYIYDIAAEALRMPSAILIPPVPPLKKNSESTYVSRVVSSNRAASLICKDLSKKSEPNQGEEMHAIYPYFHLCIDWNVTEDRQGIDAETIRNTLENGLDLGTFAGVAVTITGYENAAKNRSLARIEHLINEIVNVSSQHVLPVILPRSGWFGLSLTDLEVQGFSSLLNGNYRYTPRGGGANTEDSYGKVPMIDACCDLKFHEVMEHLRKYKEFPSVAGLPRKPSKEELDSPALFRERFAKPMRLIHMEEAHRLRAAKLKGIQSPAKHYFAKSKNEYLRNSYQ